MYTSKADMAFNLGSNQGEQCWCGDEQASGYVHQKVWHPHSCGSERCKELEAQYQALPAGEDWEWEKIFGAPAT